MNGIERITARLDADTQAEIDRIRESAKAEAEKVAQGRVAAASINLLAKKPDDWSKGMVLCITVEFYAILSLLASMLMLINISA